MRRLDLARTKARELRQTLKATNTDLLLALRERLWDSHFIELVPANRDGLLQGSRGEIVPAEGCLYYSRQLEAVPEELLEVVAHEYGHLILHHNAFAPAAEDLIRGSVFLNSGASALSRYSPHSRSEIEASAFAAELICPSQEVFGKWRSTPGVTLSDLASEYQASPRLVRQQLAEGLYTHVTGEPVQRVTSSNPPTSEQEIAATVTGPPVLVDAGPGTGKTLTLVRRIEFLVRDQHVSPENILVLTFSNEAANELQERIAASIGTDASRITATTFHGFGMLVLDALGQHIGLDSDFSIMDEICQEELVTELLGDVDCEALLDIRNPSQTAAEVVRHISYLKDRLISPAALAKAIVEWPSSDRDDDTVDRARALQRLYERYEQVKSDQHRVDFADLIAFPHKILAERQEIRENLRKEFSWVLVDEYQDVSRSTALFLQQLCGPDNPPWVVGDARQAIYRFRGAEPENIIQFAQDFPDAKCFELRDNYRSAPEIIALINELAAFLEDPERSGPLPERWRAAGSIKTALETPMGLAEATSDAAEREGIVNCVSQWLQLGIEPENIAVLARRNSDVRNIAISLKERSIRAVTSGLLTAEGAGGDMAAVLSAVDLQQALPRVVYAVYRHRASSAVLNAVATQLIAESVDQEKPSFSGNHEVLEIASEMWTLFQQLHRRIHTDDGWTILCDFLFFDTSYTRNLLDITSDAAGAVQLEEVLSALALAAQYRFTHPHVQPLWSRLGLAERVRNVVTQAAPGIVPPRSIVNAVRVMTCHASKGLEFPCVAVAGQSLPDIPPQKECLPPQVRPNPDNDLLQAESLLFVGVSRAQRSVMISYATSASGTPRSRRRRFPVLLTKLRESGTIPLIDWDAQVPVGADFTVERIWGGKPPAEISMYALGKDTCRVRTYIEEQLGARFRGRIRPLYPDFIDRIRHILQGVIAKTIGLGRALNPSDINEIVEKEWPPDHQAKHPHIELYRPRASHWARMLAATLDRNRLQNAVDCEEPFEWKDQTGKSLKLKLHLLAQLRDSNGDRIVLALQPTGPLGNALNWSDLKDYQRLPFILLHERHGDVQPYVFTGSDGQIRPFKWKRGKSPSDAVTEQSSVARAAFDRLVTGAFDGTIDDWTCDRCASRTLCPGWIGAVSSTS